MASVTVRIPAPLRPLAGGADEVLVQAASVGEALERGLDAALVERILTPQGEIGHFVNLYLGEHNVIAREGLATRVKDGDVLAIVPAVVGARTGRSTGA
jgi:molybdopterin converting factor small subunit